jgi:hypothetical protein
MSFGATYARLTVNGVLWIGAFAAQRFVADTDFAFWTTLPNTEVFDIGAHRTQLSSNRTFWIL